MEFYQVVRGLHTHRKTLRFARLLSINKYEAVGRITALWDWAMENAPAGEIIASDAESISDAMGWDGPTDQLISALQEAGLLDISDTGYTIHDWMDYTGDYVREREETKAKDRERKALARAKSKQAPELGKVPAEVQRKSSGSPEEISRTIRAKPKLKLTEYVSRPSTPIGDVLESANPTFVIDDEISSTRVSAEAPRTTRAGSLAPGKSVSDAWKNLDQQLIPLFRELCDATGNDDPSVWSRLWEKYGWQLTVKDIRYEIAAAKQWLKDNPGKGRKMTTSYLANWINRSYSNHLEPKEAHQNGSYNNSTSNTSKTPAKKPSGPAYDSYTGNQGAYSHLIRS